MIPLLFIPIVFCAIAGGCRLNSLLRASPSEATVLERRLYGLATGFVTIAYLILLVGLMGVFSRVPILLCCSVLGLIGWQEFPSIYDDLLSVFKQGRPSVTGVLIGAIVSCFVATSLLGCFTPPTSVEYDALVYHLGDPKIYLAHHRIIYLPWESHSNFAFTMEMLYSIGLSVGSVPLAKLFHWTLGLVAFAATYFIGKRIHSPTAGIVGAIILISMPIVYWEAGTAYVDLAATAFGGLGLAAFIAGLESSETEPAWMRLSMIMMACMISVKATSLIPAVLMAFGFAAIVYVRQRSLLVSLCKSALYLGGAILLGSIWYVKSWIVAGNPFFPFAYSIFGGRHWSAANAQAYAQSQSTFGMGHSAAELIMAPWNIVLYVLQWNAVSLGSGHPFNDFPTPFVTLSPMLLATLFIPALYHLKLTSRVKLLGLFGLLTLVVWFALTQQVRYLMPALPTFSVLAAIVIVELWAVRSISKYVLTILLVGSTGFSLFLASLLVRAELPVVNGSVPTSDYISSGFPPYAAMEWINQNTPSNAGVVLYGEPEDFYLKRELMWGESGHGIVIPYDKMSTAADLKNWMLTHGYQYVLINSANAQFGPGNGMNGLVYNLTFASGTPPVFQDRQFTVWKID